MRLLNTRSLEFSCVYVPNRVPDYVILSHRWGSEEVTYADIIQAPLSEPTSVTRNKSGFLKVQGACALALQNGYEWIWIDSCCIDKSSSAELQETINLMWKYYKESNICLAYLEDVVDPEAGWGNDQPVGKSEWFTRGWTLQELIAPYSVEFYSSGWQPIGTKLERYRELADITGIDHDILRNNRPISDFSTAEKLSWAAHRAVTKEEDETYSLFGLFDLNLPLLYGEGRLKAFVRLQEAIYDTTSDHSIFLFLHSRSSDDYPLLAESPSQFCNREICKTCPDQEDENYSTYFSYADLVKSERWHRQAHEKIMITVTMRRNEVSTVFPLLDYPEIKDKLTLIIRLMQEDHIWSIREVFAPEEERTRVTYRLRTFHEPNKPTDRFAVTLPDGERILVKLRRLPAFARGHADGQTAKLRYMISVEADVK
ncbi:unnamed protein product [Alternaria alternata]